MKSVSILVRAAVAMAALAVLCRGGLWYVEAGQEPATTQDAAAQISDNGDETFAIVELFTSEGCSSCPPADANLKRLSEFPATKHINVIPLSFHVDYWNYLGWEDPFSDKAYSTRQAEYAKVLDKSQRVYTPQMVVNGHYTFNGSDQGLSDKAVELAMQRPVQHRVALKRTSDSPAVQTKSSAGEANRQRQQVVVEVSIQPAEGAAKQNEISDEDYEIAIVAVSDKATVQVKRGENSGQALTHVWIVRSLQTQALTNDWGSFDVSLPKVEADITRVVVFVQSKVSREITGASVLEL